MLFFEKKSFQKWNKTLILVETLEFGNFEKKLWYCEISSFDTTIEFSPLFTHMANYQVSIEEISWENEKL